MLPDRGACHWSSCHPSQPMLQRPQKLQRPSPFCFVGSAALSLCGCSVTATSILLLRVERRSRRDTSAFRLRALSPVATAAAALAVGAAIAAAVVVSANSAGTSGAQDDGPGSLDGKGMSESDGHQASEMEEELRPVLPADLEDALRIFDGDFQGPWQALGLEAHDPSVDSEQIRLAYRQAVRAEHPDTSSYSDAEERFQRVRKAYAILSDEGFRALLLEAIEQEASSFDELSDSNERSDESNKASMLRSVLMSFGLTVALGAVAMRLAEPDMQIRPAKRKVLLPVVRAPHES
eukprot:TRINITY_DN33816_c0_g1_i2.p1 TRINITY_DN33816_c0_g1~~TRINITY_DN33816_c0_g1_i2.p1  ORF type:complete len:311 (-),score=58.97 TRINITY_DN33816_c0_g1_i2:17-895(-)